MASKLMICCFLAILVVLVQHPEMVEAEGGAAGKNRIMIRLGKRGRWNREFLSPEDLFLAAKAEEENRQAIADFFLTEA